MGFKGFVGDGRVFLRYGLSIRGGQIARRNQKLRRGGQSTGNGWVAIGGARVNGEVGFEFGGSTALFREEYDALLVGRRALGGESVDLA